jgi:undecaprenyl-diphosphatase
MDFNTPGFLFFSVMLHIGTLIPVFIVFWRQIIGLFRPPYRSLILLALVSIPAAAAGYLLGDVLETVFFGVSFLWIFFLITAALLIVTEAVGKRVKPSADDGRIGVKTGLIMGFAQAVAVLPGISRSGSTICAGVLSGGKREKVARFSFFMSIPIILGSAGLTGISALREGMGDISLTAMLAGTCLFVTARATSPCGCSSLSGRRSQIRTMRSRFRRLLRC